MFDKQKPIRERQKVRSLLKLKEAEPIEGYFFCMPRERVNDLLNDERAFFPFESISGELYVVAKSSVEMAIPKDQSGDTNITNDPYMILRISPDATLEEIKQAYRQRMQEYHPDRFSQVELPEELRIMANDMASRITTSYKRLSEKMAQKEAV